MLSSNRKRLNAAHEADMAQRFPNLEPRHYTKCKLNDNSANGLTACIISWIRWHGGQAERVANQGQARVNKIALSNGLTRQTVTWTKGTGTRGTADIHAVIKGRAVKIEVKYGKDRMSEYQREYQTEIESAGGVYLIAKTFDDFLQWWDSFNEK